MGEERGLGWSALLMLRNRRRPQVCACGHGLGRKSQKPLRADDFQVGAFASEAAMVHSADEEARLRRGRRLLS
jgi:hypothetical protein